MISIIFLKVGLDIDRGGGGGRGGECEVRSYGFRKKTFYEEIFIV